MPRRNKTAKHTPYQPAASAESAKKRFGSRQAAIAAITELKKYHLDIELSVYQSPTDGGWYLTSSK